jgi:hypothetical protein
VLLLTLYINGWAERAAAMPFSAPAAATWSVTRPRPVRFAREWARRHYWQWDSRPIWDHPWRVLRPNFWGSPEPHLVPADIWACKWHLPRARVWRRRRRQCPAWQ